MTQTTERQQAARPAAAQGRILGLWVGVFLGVMGVWGCGPDAEYPKKFALQKIEYKSFNFYVFNSDGSFKQVVSIKSLPPIEDKDLWSEVKNGIESEVNTFPKFELLSDKEVRVFYRDPSIPNAPLQDTTVSYKLEGGTLTIGEDPDAFKLSGAYVDPVYFAVRGRINFYNYYEPFFKRRIYSPIDALVPIAVNNDLENLKELVAEPFTKKHLKPGDTLAISRFEFRYEQEF
jgi:hypothetical protein